LVFTADKAENVVFTADKAENVKSQDVFPEFKFYNFNIITTQKHE